MSSAKNGRKANGDGSVYFDKNKNKWFAEIHWTDKAGKKRRKRFSGSKQIAVKSKLEDFKKQLLLSDGNISNEEISFEEFTRHWMENFLKRDLKPSSYERKRVTVENQVFPLIGSMSMDDITHDDIQNMVNKLSDKGFSYSTIKKAFEVVNQSFRQYRIKTMIYINPCEGVRLPESSKQDISDVKFFNEEQRKLIVDEATRTYSTGRSVYRLGYAIVLLMYSGMRLGELIALKWEDVDFDNKLITINKNSVIVRKETGDKVKYVLENQKSTKTSSGSRVIPMTEMARNALTELYKITGDTEFVMSSQNGKQVMPGSMNKIFNSILKETGIIDKDDGTCGVHALRHTFASMLFNNGCPVKVVSEILGHSNTKITENIYIHLIQKQKMKAIIDIDKYSN